MQPNENSLKNLKPFKPGQSGNPAGRPKGGKNLSRILQEIVDGNAATIFGKDKIPSSMHDKTVGELLMLKLVALGIKDDRMAIGDVIDRLEGKPLQTQKTQVEYTEVEVEIVEPDKDPDEAKDKSDDSIHKKLES